MNSFAAPLLIAYCWGARTKVNLSKPDSEKIENLLRSPLRAFSDCVEIAESAKAARLAAHEWAGSEGLRWFDHLNRYEKERDVANEINSLIGATADAEKEAGRRAIVALDDVLSHLKATLQPAATWNKLSRFEAIGRKSTIWYIFGAICGATFPSEVGLFADYILLVGLPKIYGVRLDTVAIAGGLAYGTALILLLPRAPALSSFPESYGGVVEQIAHYEGRKRDWSDRVIDLRPNVIGHE